MKSQEFRTNPLFLRDSFQSDGVFQMSIVKKSKISLDNVEFIGYDRTKSKDKANKNKFVHFFLDDYKFEALYNNPEQRLEKLKQYKGVLTPQYSTYIEIPLALQAFNVFRSRWVGAYLYYKERSLNLSFALLLFQLHFTTLTVGYCLQKALHSNFLTRLQNLAQTAYQAFPFRFA